MNEVIEVLKNAGAEDFNETHAGCGGGSRGIFKQKIHPSSGCPDGSFTLSILSKLVYNPFRRLTFYYPDIR